MQDEIVGTQEGIVQLDGDILCHVDHQGAYTDVGSDEEARLIADLQNQPWRDVVRTRYATNSPWLYRIITDETRSRMLDELPLPEGGRFLDIGSGWGQLTVPLARRGEAHALDVTPSRLRILREIARQEGVHPHLHCGTLLTYPFREELFDVIIINGVLEYLGLGRTESDYQSQLEAMRRTRSILTSTGRVYVGIENATGLKYLLGAPDDHTGRSHFTFLQDRPNGVEAHTWTLDEYLSLFHEAGLEPEKVFACFPDYKLIRHMIPLQEVDQFLLQRGLPASEHSGANGAPLDMDAELRSLYTTLARLGVSRYFVPSFGFVLRPSIRSLSHAKNGVGSLETVVADALHDSEKTSDTPPADIKVTPTLGRVNHIESCQTRRYFVREEDLPVASVKQVPLTKPFCAEAILAVYDEYRQAKSFRPVSLLKHWEEDQSLWFTEEYIENAVSLDDLVRTKTLTHEEATERLVAIADDVWEMGTPVDPAQLEQELQTCESWFTELFGSNSAGRAIYQAFREMILSHREHLRTVLTTRDYIGRNVLLANNQEWVLIDYDLASRSSLFAVDLARNLIHVPYCTDRLLQAKAFHELDPCLVKIASTAAECALQRMVLPPERHDEVFRSYRSILLRLLAPTCWAGYQASQEELEGQVRSASDYQMKLEGKIEQARAYQANLEHQISVLRRPRVDVMVVNYNGDRWIDGFVDSLRQTSYPAERLRLIFVDNNSTDESLEHARRKVESLPFPTVFAQTGYNAGFTGGYAKAFECGDAEYFFVINTDTAMAQDAIDKLIAVLEADSTAGIAEARQAPLEHPKYFDPVTRETSWCSGACMMVREKALRSIGGEFDSGFFMYAEDVDLSWRMWLHGWKCLYVRDAVVQHFTEHLDPLRDHSIQHYFSMRNGALMRVIYGSWAEVLLHYAAMLRVGTLSNNPRRHKLLTLKAILASLKRLPRAMRKRYTLQKFKRNEWVFFNGWLYGRHAMDPSAEPAADYECTSNLLSSWESTRKELRHDLPIDQHITRAPDVHVAGIRQAAALVYDSGRLHYQIPIPPRTVLSGSIAAPQDTWRPTATGRFEVSQNDRCVWNQELDLGNLAHRKWVPFEVPLQETKHEETSRITLSFDGGKDLQWGLWGNLRLEKKEEKPKQENGLSALTGLAVSVVVPTHNRSERLERVIQRLMTQDIPARHFEIILVDSNSRDETPQVMSRLSQRYKNLKTLRCDRSGAAAARNMGLEAAEGELVILVDDDILVGTDFLRQLLLAKFENPGCVLLGKIIAPWDGSANPFHRYLLQVQDVNTYDFPDSKNVPANYFYTACVAIPREVLGDKRFDEGFRVYGVEDIEYGFRLLEGDTRMVFLPKLQVLHDYHPDYRTYRTKKHKAGYSLGYFLAEHPEHAHRFQFGPRFRKYYHVLRIMRTLGKPVAALLHFGEKLLYREGPVNKALYRWWYVDLRIQLYSGMQRFRRGKEPPK